METSKIYFKRDHVIYIVFLAALLLVCSGIEDKIAKIVTGTACARLENPEHGKYVCIQEDVGEKCVLVCSAGYVHPNSEYRNDGKHIPLTERGVYRCVRTSGGVIWLPNIFFDCIEHIYPASFQFYYGLTMIPYPSSCVNNSEREDHLSRINPNSFRGNGITDCINLLNAVCRWTFDIGCVGGVWEMDAWFRIPFTMQALEDFNRWQWGIKRALQRDADSQLRINRQREATIVNSKGFSLLCPRATRLENDYSCRGCSKGFYMSLDINECLPCPTTRYQDENFEDKCKPCPPGGAKKHTGLTSLIECFDYDFWEQNTSIVSILGTLSCVVILSVVLLIFRSQVLNEPDGIHREVYKIPEYIPGGGGRLQRMIKRLAPSYSICPYMIDSMQPFTQDETLEESLAFPSGPPKKKQKDRIRFASIAKWTNDSSSSLLSD